MPVGEEGERTRQYQATCLSLTATKGKARVNLRCVDLILNKRLFTLQN